MQLAAAYCIFAHLGWQELIYDRLSLRVPGEPGHFLLNPFGLHDTEVCASNLVKVDDGLRFTNFYAAQLHGKAAHHDFEGITVHADEGARILASARGAPVLLLRNHGPVVIGQTLAQAFNLLWVLRRACELQLASQALGRLRAIPTPVLQGCVRDSLNFNTSFGAGQDSFDAMQRLVDRIDPSYRG